MSASILVRSDAPKEAGPSFAAAPFRVSRRPVGRPDPLAVVHAVGEVESRGARHRLRGAVPVHDGGLDARDTGEPEPVGERRRRLRRVAAALPRRADDPRDPRGRRRLDVDGRLDRADDFRRRSRRRARRPRAPPPAGRRGRARGARAGAAACRSPRPSSEAARPRDQGSIALGGQSGSGASQRELQCRLATFWSGTRLRRGRLCNGTWSAVYGTSRSVLQRPGPARRLVVAGLTRGSVCLDDSERSLTVMGLVDNEADLVKAEPWELQAGQWHHEVHAVVPARRDS